MATQSQQYNSPKGSWFTGLYQWGPWSRNVTKSAVCPQIPWEEQKRWLISNRPRSSGCLRQQHYSSKLDCKSGNDWSNGRWAIRRESKRWLCRNEVNWVIGWKLGSRRYLCERNADQGSFAVQICRQNNQCTNFILDSRSHECSRVWFVGTRKSLARPTKEELLCSVKKGLQRG